MLPSERYPAKLVVVLRCWSTLGSKRALRQRVAEALEGVREANPAVALVQHVLLGATDLAERLSGTWPLVALLDSLTGGTSLTPQAASARLAASEMARSGSQGPLRFPDDLEVPGPAFELLATFGGRCSDLTKAAPDFLATLPMSVLDDLIDQGALPAGVVGTIPVVATRTYLQARLDPARLTDVQVEQLDFTRERARRALAQGDHEALRTLGDDPEAAGFRAISGLLRGEYRPVQMVPGMNPEQHDKLNALAACVQADSLEPATPALLSDNALWPVLRRWAAEAANVPALRSEEGREFLAVAKLNVADRALRVGVGEDTGPCQAVSFDVPRRSHQG